MFDSNINFKKNKKSQNLLYSYMFYILLSLIVLSSVYFFSSSLNNDIQDLKEYREFEASSNLYIQNFLKSLQLPNSQINFDRSTSFSNSNFILKTNSYYTSFETTKFAYFYKSQVKFCENYTINLASIEYVELDTAQNCINIKETPSLLG